MATTQIAPPLYLGPASAGMLMTPEEFDAADFEEGWRYELINEVLVVSPTPSRGERDPNEELGRWLRNYQEDHPLGGALDLTINEETVPTGQNRRRPDRTIWAGLGRLPTADDLPTIVVEFVSAGRRNRRRDYETKRAEYAAIGAQEYWIIDRFQRTMTVVTNVQTNDQPASPGSARVLNETETYRSPLLPGFELPLARLFALADRWKDPE